MSCLFISLARLLNIDHSVLRHQICNYIIHKSDKMWDGTKISDWIEYAAGDRYQSVQQYVDEMRNSSQWGGAPEIAICCMIYNVSIEVINLQNTPNTKVLFKDSDNQSVQKPTIRSETWQSTLYKLYREYPGLERMRLFSQHHPLRKNYETFINEKKQEYLILQHPPSQITPRQIPTLVITWTGNHYEPRLVKNPRPI